MAPGRLPLPRCPHRIDICAQEPALEQSEPGHARRVLARGGVRARHAGRRLAQTTALAPKHFDVDPPPLEVEACTALHRPRGGWFERRQVGSARGQRCRSPSGAARRWAWSASPVAARRRSAASSCAWRRRPPARCASKASILSTPMPPLRDLRRGIQVIFRDPYSLAQPTHDGGRDHRRAAACLQARRRSRGRDGARRGVADPGRPLSLYGRALSA